MRKIASLSLRAQNMTQVPPSTVLPAIIELKLNQVRRRRALVSLLRTIAVGTSVLTATMVIAMLIDWELMLFDTGLRTALTITSLVLTAWAVLLTTAPILITSMGRLDAARDVDGEIPQLEERWQTITEVANAGCPLTTPSTKAMLQQVISEAAAFGQIVQPSRVVKLTSLKTAANAAALCLLIFVGFLALDWQQTSVLLRRFCAPAANISATSIHSATGDRIIPRGQFMELVGEVTGLQRKSAMLTIVRADSKPELFDLVADNNEANRFVHRIRVDEPFQYRFRAGDGQTSWHRIRAVDYPALADVRLTIVAPAYLNRSNVEKTVIPNRLKVIQGSALQLQLRPKQPLERLELSIVPDSDAQGKSSTNRQLHVLTQDPDGWYRFNSQLFENVLLTPHLWNEHALTNEDRHVCRIQVVADNAPVARVLNSATEMAASPDDVLEIKFEAHDDYGITKAELVVYDESSTVEGKPATVLKVLPIPLEERQLAKHLVTTTKLDLKELNLKPGAQISYAVRVTDNRAVVDDRTPTSTRHLPSVETTAAKTAADRKQSPLYENKTAKEGDGISHSDDARRVPTVQTDDQAGAGSTNSSHETAAAAAGSPIFREKEQADSPQQKMINELATSKSESNEASRTVASNDAGTDLTKKALSAIAPTADASEAVRGTLAILPVAPLEQAPKLLEAIKGRDPVSKISLDPIPDKNKQSPDITHPKAGSERMASETLAGDAAEISHIKETQSNPTESEQLPPSRRLAVLVPQQSESGQNAESNRPRLKITERMTATAEARETRKTDTNSIREQVFEIDTLLAEVELDLTRIVNREILEDAQRAQYKALDIQLGVVDDKISDLRKKTRDEQFAFVGLQMVEIGRSHVTPARDRIFMAIREPASRSSLTSAVALQQIVRARELLDALLKRYDRVARDQQLAASLKDGVKMYEVYVEKMQQLMREVRDNRNPLDRKMAVIEVGQDYLDRFAEVLTMRRQMLAEFGRILGDDPRLLARYLDLVKRRRESLRDQLSVLARRQAETFAELNDWLAADTTQREELWNVVVELRMQASTQLAKDAAELAERIEKQFPLVLDGTQGTSAKVISIARQIAEKSRSISLEARRQIHQIDSSTALRPKAEQLVELFIDLDVKLEYLDFENAKEAEVRNYVTGRLLENRTVADQANTWSQVVQHIQEKQFHRLIEVDQHQIAIATELLRVDMLGIEIELAEQFQQVAEMPVPVEILNQIGELHQRMEEISFEQTSASFALIKHQLPTAAKLFSRTSSNFTQSEELFDRIRLAIATALDDAKVRNPTIAELEDPKLDEFLTQLEREPNIEAQLGIPERPRNLRVIAESMTWQQEGGGLLGILEEKARGRLEKEMRTVRDEDTLSANPKPQSDGEQAPHAEERRRRKQAIKTIDELSKVQKLLANDASADPAELKNLEQAAEQLQDKANQLMQEVLPDDLWKQMNEDLEQALPLLKEHESDPSANFEDSNKLAILAKELQRVVSQTSFESNPEKRWKLLAEFERKLETMKAFARGERIPDEQWNKLLSTLDDGLRQVGGRAMPEEYRKAIEQYQEQIRKLTNSSKEDER